MRRDFKRGFLGGQVPLLQLMSKEERRAAEILATHKVKEVQFQDRTLQQICTSLTERLGVKVLYADEPSEVRHSIRLHEGNLMTSFDRIARELNFSYLIKSLGESGNIMITVRNLPYSRDIIGQNSMVVVDVEKGFLNRIGSAQHDGGDIVDCTGAFVDMGCLFPVDASGRKAFVQFNRRTGKLIVFNFDSLTREVLAVLEKKKLMRIGD